MKTFIILGLIVLLMLNNLLNAQDPIKGGYRNSSIYKYDYKNGVIDSNSKEIFKILTYNHNGYKVEEKYFWEGKLSHTNNYFYDSLNNIQLNVRKSSYYYNNYSIKYFYDEKGNNINVYIYSKGDTIIGHQNINYDSNRKVIKHVYYGINDSANVIETFDYNEKGLLIKKKISTFREGIMDINENYKYDSNDILIEVSIERIPELISRKDVFYWKKEELGYVLIVAIPLPPFEKGIYFYYDKTKRLSQKRTYSGDDAALKIIDYVYDESVNLKKEIISFDYSPIKEKFKSKNLDYLYDELAPIHFKNKSGEPSQEFLYNYTR